MQFCTGLKKEYGALVTVANIAKFAKLHWRTVDKNLVQGIVQPTNPYK